MHFVCFAYVAAAQRVSPLLRHQAHVLTQHYFALKASAKSDEALCRYVDSSPCSQDARSPFEDLGESVTRSYFNGSRHGESPKA